MRDRERERMRVHAHRSQQKTLLVIAVNVIRKFLATRSRPTVQCFPLFDFQHQKNPKLLTYTHPDTLSYTHSRTHAHTPVNSWPFTCVNDVFSIKKLNLPERKNESLQLCRGTQKSNEIEQGITGAGRCLGLRVKRFRNCRSAVRRLGASLASLGLRLPDRKSEREKDREGESNKKS